VLSRTLPVCRRSSSLVLAAACVLGLIKGGAVELPSGGVETLEFSWKRVCR
jgi:hypothetical protein